MTSTHFRDLKGNIVTLVDLPPENTIFRWVANRKFVVLRAVEEGMITLEECLKRYRVTAEELEMWRAGLSESGVTGLLATRACERVQKPIDHLKNAR